ncbi:MAG: sulfatase-like hydrolase/transferase, partial [Bacteroidetes bacterium]|nr:sulfatase-like hydrolase/transferase [Bacteroidota bacterium]
MKSYQSLFVIPLIIGSNLFGQQKSDELSSSKPNILWVTIEDTSPQFIGCYGNEDARTPVIDKLADEGVR